MAATPTISENGTTFTPGPWEVIDGNVVATQFKGTTPVVMPDGETRQHQTGLLALVYSPGDLTLNFEANARLISAPGARRSYQSGVRILFRSETCRGDPEKNGDHAAQACRLISSRGPES